ncbi:MAG: hypothetical protein QXI58_00850 [Candidatus Micrarchaeia archaeon]
MIRIIKNYNFEVLPFEISSDIVNFVLEEGEWGYIDYDGTSNQLIFACFADGAKPTPDQVPLTFPIIRGSAYFGKKTPGENQPAAPIDRVAVLERKRGLIIETDKFTGTIVKGDKLTIVGVANKGGLLAKAGTADGVVGICLGVTPVNTIIVELT